MASDKQVPSVKDRRMRIGDSYNYLLPALPDYLVPAGTVLRVTQDYGPRREDTSNPARSFEAEVVSLPPEEPKVVTINVPKGTTVKIVEV